MITEARLCDRYVLTRMKKGKPQWIAQVMLQALSYTLIDQHMSDQIGSIANVSEDKVTSLASQGASMTSGASLRPFTF